MEQNKIEIIFDLFMEQNKKFFVERRGKQAWILIRQLPHDPQYKPGSHIPGYGKVVAVQEAN